jgi:hypothetical protein
MRSTIDGIVALDGIGVIDLVILAGFVSWILLASAGSAVQEMRRERLAGPPRERVASPPRERVASPRRARVAAPERERRSERRSIARRAGVALGTIRASMRRLATVAAGGDP